jgi:hypothetical protein
VISHLRESGCNYTHSKAREKLFAKRHNNFQNFELKIRAPWGSIRGFTVIVIRVVIVATAN